MADSRADQCLREHDQLMSRRGIWESHWREVAERVRPNQNYFQRRERPDGDKRMEKVFDVTAMLALPKFAAAVISMAFPSTQTYHRLTCIEEGLNKSPAVGRWLDDLNKLLFKVRYSPRANFQAQSGEIVLDIGSFGTGILFVDDVLGLGIRYKSFPLAECYIAEDAHGVVDTLHRDFKLTAHQAASLFGLDKLPEKIRTAVEKTPYEKFDFLHVVKPNPETDTRRKDWRGMPFYSCYTAKEGRQVVDVGGFRVFPFAVPRYETNSRECYGRSPAMNVLPAIKMINEQKKTVLRAGQKVVAPPLMLTDDGSLQGFNARPDALNYGYVSQDGRPLAIPLQTNARVDIGRDMMQDERDAINDAFLVTLFRILVDEPQITATEAMLRAQEKGQLLAPTMGRMQTELLAPIVAREIDILAQPRLGGSIIEQAIGPMPQELVEAGGEVKIEYMAPLNLAQRAGAGIAIMNTIQAVAPLAQINPDVMMIFNPEMTARELAEINGFPTKALYTEDEVDAKKEQSAQAQQMQTLLHAAPVAASAAKDFAQAQALAGSAPGGQAPAIIPQGA